MNESEINNNLKLIEKSWELFKNKLQIKIEFSDLVSAFNFMKETAKVSEDKSPSMLGKE